MAASSNYKARWRCSAVGCRHTWRATVGDRVSKKSGCPACAGKVVKPDGSNSLAAVHPELAAQWHPDNPRTAEQTTAASGRMVLWLCDVPACRHVWKVRVSDRAAYGTGCPVCSGRKVHTDGRNSLARLRPDLAAEWHPTRNGRLAPEAVTVAGSRRVWWRCTRFGHEWQAAIHARSSLGSGCPVCYLPHRSRREVFIAFELAALFEEIDPSARFSVADWKGSVDLYVPSVSVGVEYDGVRWHSGPEAAARERRKVRAFSRQGVDILRIRESPLPLASTWDVRCTAHTPAHLVAAEVADRLVNRFGAVPSADLVAYRREAKPVAREEARSFLQGLLKDGDAELACGHPRVALSTAGSCETCAEARASERRARLLSVTHPALADEWHPANDRGPDQITFGSRYEAKWVCGRCGTAWAGSVRSRTRKRYPRCCPNCPGKTE